ncbi:MAG: 23S rRNA pseudouridine(2604) synthase RluF [Candidatus Magasanikbacteria bacterium]|nr:23S rRNA pseudouridine(2604) synthase RluF [Candidatus Magasanikbacteria bacterium]
MSQETTRLNKYLSQRGLCSRREADRLIEEGRISVNGKKAELGTHVSPTDEVRVNGKIVSGTSKEEPFYLAFNKPVGIICTTDKNSTDTIIDYIDYPTRIFPIGRLDVASQGLILLTNDGDSVNKILRAEHNHEKEYIVTVHKPISGDFIRKMSEGVPILDTITKKCSVKKIGQYQFVIILTQGLNRQIRRMCEYFGYAVTKLKRVRIMHIALDNLPVGQYRKLSKKEVLELNQLLNYSKSTTVQHP